jgi:hypothetical protein
MKLQRIKEQALEANLELVRRGAVLSFEIAIEPIRIADAIKFLSIASAL